MASHLHVGAARANITPELGIHMQGYFNDRQAEDVADELHASAIVLENEDTALAIVVCDLIGCYRRDLDAAKARAAELTGIPADHIFISCTHTHYGPNTLQLAHLPCEAEYTARAMHKVGDAVRLARNRLKPASFAHASGQCPEETHNRRWHMKDGSVRMNPGYLNRDAVRPAGPTDPEVALAVFIDEDGHPLAALANYSLHYVGCNAHTAISANYFGAFARALERMAGAPLVAVMANGCCGDINNCNVTRSAPPVPHPHYQVQRVGNVVAACAYGAWQQIRNFDPYPVLGLSGSEVPFQRREHTPAQVAQAEIDIKRQEEIGLVEWVYALETLEMRSMPLSWQVPVSALRIGDLGMVGLPGEMFVQYGLQIKAQSPFARTMVIELANDFVGYCPTDAALAEGGYETRLGRWAMAAQGTETQMVTAALENLRALA